MRSHRVIPSISAVFDRQERVNAHRSEERARHRSPCALPPTRWSASAFVHLRTCLRGLGVSVNSNAKGRVWGVSAIAHRQTHTDSPGESAIWGQHPTAVGVPLHWEQGGPWVYGVLVNAVGPTRTGDCPSHDNGLIQPVLNCSCEAAARLPSAHHRGRPDSRTTATPWSIPLGDVMDPISHLGPLPVDTGIDGHHNVVTPGTAPAGSFATQMAGRSATST